MKKKLLTLLVMCLGIIGLFYSSIRVSAQEEVETQYGQVVNYITNHLNEFKNEYNKENPSEPLRATKIEKDCLVYIIDSNKYGVYLDFNEDKGYLVTSLEYDLYLVNTTDDLDYLKEVDFTYYSTLDGFLYNDGSSYQKYVEDDLGEEGNSVFTYNGQVNGIETNIYDIEAYMADRYPSYTLVSKNERMIEKYFPTTMMRTSYFIKYESADGGNFYNKISSEGNCSLTAAFNVMMNWQAMVLTPNLPTKSINMDMTSLVRYDSHYNEYGVGVPMVGQSSYWTVNSESILYNMPLVYYHLRQYASLYGDYTPVSGLNLENTKDAMLYALYVYGYDFPLRTSTAFSDLIISLNINRAAFMGLRNCQDYAENHAVALLGYRQYSYETGFWIFTKTEYAYFGLIDDGHDGCVEYIDLNCNSKMSFEFIFM